MAVYQQYDEDLQFDDDDAKADELPEDEYEGDASTGGILRPAPSLPPQSSYSHGPMNPPRQKNHGPRPVPPVMDANGHNKPAYNPPFPMNDSHTISPRQSSTDYVYSPTDGTEDENTSNIMAFGANSIQPSLIPQSSIPHLDQLPYPQSTHNSKLQNHFKSEPISFPQLWTCTICTFAENTMDAPMCMICGALPPFQEDFNSKPVMRPPSPQRHQSQNVNRNQVMNQNCPYPHKAKSNPLMESSHDSNPMQYINAVMNHQEVMVSNVNNANHQMNQMNQMQHRSVMSDVIGDTVLSPKAHQPDHHQHRMWQVQQNRVSSYNHNGNPHQQNGINTHVRALSHDQPVAKNQMNAASRILPNFMEEDDYKMANPRHSTKSKHQKSVAQLVAEENAISVLHDIPVHEQALIEYQIQAIATKPQLQNELAAVKATIHKKIKKHHKSIVALHKQRNKLRGEEKTQSKLWNDYAIVILQKLCSGYFSKLFELLETRIQIETYYLKCFELKLEKIKFAVDKLSDFIEEWDMDDARQYVKSTMMTISKIRTSPEVHLQKESLDGIRSQIQRLEREYEGQKEVLNTPQVDHSKRTSHILFVLKGIINEFNAGNENIKLTATYFCKPEVQEMFNSFVLDQRVEIGKVVRNWTAFLEKNEEKEIVFKDIYIFIQRLLNTFLKSYSLDQTSGRYNFYEYCLRFMYPCILNLEMVDKILAKIAQTASGKKEYQLLSAQREYTLFAHFLQLKYMMG